MKKEYPEQIKKMTQKKKKKNLNLDPACSLVIQWHIVCSVRNTHTHTHTFIYIYIFTLTHAYVCLNSIKKREENKRGGNRRG
jgi:hypothetical protein